MNSSTIFVVLLQWFAIFLFIFGFFGLKKVEEAAEIEHVYAVQDQVCSVEPTSLESKKLVLIVIDSFRDDFFFKSTAMKETRNFVYRGEAHAFTAKLQSPTAIVSGLLPTFMDLIWNFASSKLLEDNWLKQAKANGKKIVFYGDDTWLRIFPEKIFEQRSGGVSSFWVNDYTEVDDNVTRHLSKELTPEGQQTWDVLILHYLGLDHIGLLHLQKLFLYFLGHSLGGEHPQLEVKLKEMDKIILETTKKLREISKDFVVVITGDHGMTLGGGHGGNSHEETRVPVIIIGDENKLFSEDQKNEIISGLFLNLQNYFVEEEIEQVDLTPIISSLLNLPHVPRRSLGVMSFLPKIEDNWRKAAHNFRKNCHHFVDFLSGQRGNVEHKELNECLIETADICSSRPSRSKINRTFKKCQIGLRKAQHEILGEMANFEYKYIVLGITICVFCILYLFLRSFGVEYFTNLNITKLIFIQPFLLFSSSFCEEEHDLWYFIYPLILVSIIWKHAEFASKGQETYKKQKITFLANLLKNEKWFLVILLLQRLATQTFASQKRRWKIFDWGWNFDFVVLPIGAWFNSLWSNYNSIFVFGIIIFLNIKFVFGNISSIKWHTIPALFGLICLFILKNLNLDFILSNGFLEKCVQISIFWLFCSGNFSLCLSIWVLFVAPSSLVHLYLILWIIGWSIGRLSTRLVDFEPNELAVILHCAISAAFFNTGNTNGISTVQVAPGYTGLNAYYPILIGIQILLNSYIGPIAIFIGWQQSGTYDKKFTQRKHSKEQLLPGFEHKVNEHVPYPLLDILVRLLALRSFSLFASMLSLFNFRFHLFVWSVFAPKFLYEISHFLILTIFTLSTFLYSKVSR